MNQTDLGKADRSQSFVSVHPEPAGIEDDRRSRKRGQRRLDLSDLILVCGVIGVEPAELLGRLD